ncbi:unnamed protein product [Kuraishia capsulata CBS 1993]|uniref:Signal recognition particle receptor subunit beta n=1 Tax=Kuraishia capsulata CBS 1993 TaxID=1382522 RepID=W6MQG1_9ASCO|nr:uncharacterized protein KUCA_T00003475001 [Kuraishia capsulata CBS 1993]CDK27497.1 unnamed protein product [Kuraishia capsulata CBS 1993]
MTPTVAMDLHTFILDEIDGDNVSELPAMEFTLKCYDLSGQKRFQTGLWRRYLDIAGLILFVVDLSDDLTLHAAKQLLVEIILENERGSKKPILIIGNKLDLIPSATTFLGVETSGSSGKANSVTSNKANVMNSNRVVRKKKSLLPIDKLPNTVNLLDKADVFAQFLGILVDVSANRVMLKYTPFSNNTAKETDAMVPKEQRPSYGSVANTGAKPNGPQSRSRSPVKQAEPQSLSPVKNQNQSEELVELDMELGIFVTSLKSGQHLEDVVRWIAGSA